MLSLTGDIAGEKGEPKLHLHAVLGGAAARPSAVNFREARVRPTLEVIVNKSPAYLRVFTISDRGWR
ncbi:MAG: hypothetical protein JOZ58_27880 [Acetobacteraceae bacterium]|nr:hypothetical protein [Acetobacteraceae bacterium]